MTNTQLTLITKAVDPNPTLPFLKNVLVRPAHDHITLTAINMTKSWGMISVTIPCLTTRKQNYAIAIGDLKHHIKAKSCDPFAPITPISAKDTAELIKCLGEGASATEFPPTAAEYPAQAMLDAEYAISKDETRYVLNGTLLEAGNIVTTNGRCLYVSEGHKPVNDKPLIVPDSKLMRAFHRTAAKNENNFIQVTEKNGETYLRLRTYGNGVNAAYVTKAVAGNYPNWIQVMPKKAEVTVQFTPQHVLDALASLPFHLKDDDRGMGSKTKAFTFRVRKGVSQIVMSPLDGPEHARNVFCIADGTMDISFDANLLVPALQAGFSTMQGIDEISPGLFTKTDDPHNARFVLMPIRTAQPEQAKAA